MGRGNVCVRTVMTGSVEANERLGRSCWAFFSLFFLSQNWLWCVGFARDGEEIADLIHSLAQVLLSSPSLPPLQIFDYGFGP